MIQQLEEKQLSNIYSYLKHNMVKIDPEKSISISNCYIQSCVEQYDNIKSSTTDCISEFASNASGMTSYHYLKLDGILYILQAWIGDIAEIYNVTDRWIHKHRVLFKNI